MGYKYKEDTGTAQEKQHYLLIILCNSTYFLNLDNPKRNWTWVWDTHTKIGILPVFKLPTSHGGIDTQMLEVIPSALSLFFTTLV